MAYRAAVIGASGYTGAETLRILAAHPEIDVVHVTADSNAGAAVTELYPNLAAAYGHLRFAPFAVTELDGIDVAFVALPHGESQRLMPGIVDRVAHVIDIGADFRLPAKVYEQWYGEPHAAPTLLELFSYGLPELFRDHVEQLPHVANPGCYPTAASLALAPFLVGQWIEPTGIIVDAISGVSGRGRGLTTPSLYSEANENVGAYGLLTHRHTAEIELALSHAARTDVQVLFTPHLAPLTRGISATCHARPAVDNISTGLLLDTMRDFYRDEPFVIVLDDVPTTKATVTSNAVHVTARYDARTGSVLAIATEDNLVKGAAGQAVQNANIVLDLPETIGLSAIGVMP